MNWTEEQLAERNRQVFGAGKCECGCSYPDDFGGADKTEALIEAECTKLLEEDGWRALRTDPVSDRGRGKGFGELGMADHLYMRYRLAPRPILKWPEWAVIKEFAEIIVKAEVLWIEFKSPKGKPKKHQLEWHTKERARGALTWIASVDFPATVEGFRAHYAASGLQRRRP